MKNYIQRGDSITVAAPAAVTSGAGVLIGSLFGVAATDAETGADVAISTVGVFDLPKEPTTDTFAVGAPVEWDAANDRVTALDEGVQIGVAVAAAGATAATVAVRLG
ncbi:DUF2190 family protein [Marinibacterium profundimaris]|uniref:RecA/RadA recombinase n=1 Tax=Marinibacterium profundimaris TaxID=1679460 RepID=A0A225NBA8_9RHOB|nr:DUF2190 family protein [Marinibacterium profundimaris]OWU67799.1 hypothetical protein ATO3_25555 [Marinibacterium profundimaris]